MRTRFLFEIPVSAIVATAQAIPGVMSVTVNTLERLGEDSRALLDLEKGDGSGSWGLRPNSSLCYGLIQAPPR